MASGIDPYIDVVILQTNLLADQQTLANLPIEQMTAVQLVEALGGGWDESQLPFPRQVTEPAGRTEAAIQSRHSRPH